MNFSWLLLVTLTFCLALTTTQSSKRLYAVDSAKSKRSNNIFHLRRSIQGHTTSCAPGCITFRDPNGNPTRCRCPRELSKGIDTKEEACLDIVPGERNMELILDSKSMTCRNYTGYYHVQVWKEPEDQELQHYICPTIPCSVELKPCTEYNVQVMCASGIVIFERTIKTLESAPGMIRDLTIKSVFPDKVTGKWESPLQTNGQIRSYTVTIQRIKLFGCEDFNRTSPPESEKQKTVNETTASFSGLHPYAQYNFTVIANTVEPGPPLSKVFETHQLSHPTSKINDLRIVNETILVWNRPENCTTITGPAKATALIVSGVSSWVKNWRKVLFTTDTYYDLKTQHLLSYTRYEVRAWVNRGYGKPARKNNYQKMFWTTAPTVPPAVKNVVIYDADAEANTISIRWEPPYPANGEIESYEVYLMFGNSVLGHKSIRVFELKNCMLTYVCFENFSFSPNISTNIDLKLQIFAKNLNVRADGAETTIEFKLEDLYDKEPSQPENFTAITQSYGIVTLKWMHPSFSPTTIVRFYIEVEPLLTNQARHSHEIHLTYDYPIIMKQKVYSKILYLPIFTEYRISIKAVNYHKRDSATIIREISILARIVSTSDNVLHIDQRNETSIELKVPAVKNRVNNTQVVVAVKNLSKYKQNSPAKHLSHSINETQYLLEWIAAVYWVNNIEPIQFTIDVDQRYGIRQDCFFQRGETYEFMVILNDWYSWTSVYFKSASFKFLDSNLQGN